MRIPPAGVQRTLDLLDADLTHIALDAGETTDAGLAAEHYRAPVGATLRDGNITVREVYMDETQANGHITGLAILAGATDAPGTGTLFAYEGVDIEKIYRESLTVSVEITVEVTG